MQFQAAVARHLQDAQHLDRLGIEIAAGHRQQLALRQHEAGVEQRLIGFRLDRRRAQRGAQDRRLQDAGQAHHLARGEEVVAHETLDAVLPAVPRIAHARADHRLHVEGQAFLGAAGDVVQMEPHGPEEFPGAAAVPGLRWVRMPPTSASSPIVWVPKRNGRSSTASACRAARRGLP